MLRTTLHLALCALLSLATAATAQETVNNATLSGQVTDPTGAAVRGAAVTAVNTSTSGKIDATTDNSGRFRFPYLQVGDYVLTIHHDGFSDAKRNVTLTLGAAFDLSIPLTVGTTQSVTVNTTPPVLETDRSQIATTIAQNEVSDLPY